MKLNWNFLGGRGVQNKKTFHGGSMDIFCNCTLDEVLSFLNLVSLMVHVGASL